MQGQLHLIPPPTMRQPTRGFSRGLVIVIVAVLAAMGILAVIASRHWPFTRAAIIQDLQKQSGGSVQLTGFRHVFFPHPGCVAEGVTIRRNGDETSPPFITIRKLHVVGTYSGLLTRSVRQIRAEDMHVVVRRRAGNEGLGQGTHGISTTSAAAIGEIVADGAQVEIEPAKPGQEPLRFLIQKLSLHSVAGDHPLSFHAILKLPEPPGDLTLTGQIGPFKSGDYRQTPLSGSYTLQRADLRVFRGIAGTLSSSGKFSGVLEHVEVSGTTDVPDFELTRNKHAVHLTTRFQAAANGLKGDVTLDPVVAHWGRSTIVAKASIQGSTEDQGKEKHGKIVTLKGYSTKARTEDLLKLFTRGSPPAMTGDIVFRANVTLPPEERPFLDRVRLDGDFGIAGGQYTSSHTQKNVDVLSARARGQADKVEDKQDKDENYDPGRVLSNVKGRVVLRDGVAHLGNVSFDVPGASAVVSGTYNLKSEGVNLKGPLRLEAPLSKATTGVKSILLKVIQPLVHKKNQKGSTVEVKVAGTYNHPSFSVAPIPRN